MYRFALLLILVVATALPTHAQPGDGRDPASPHNTRYEWGAAERVGGGSMWKVADHKDSTVDFSWVPINSCKRMYVEFVNIGYDSVTLAATYPPGSSNDQFEFNDGNARLVLPPMAPGSRGIFVPVRFCPRSPGGDASATILLSDVNDPLDFSRQVHLHGVGTQAVVQVTAQRDLRVNVSDCHDLLVQVKNITDKPPFSSGGINVFLDSVAILGGSQEYAIISGPIARTILSPGATQEYWVRFCPKTSGDRDGTIRVLFSFYNTAPKTFETDGHLHCIGEGPSDSTASSNRPMLYFGPMQEGDCRLDTFMLRNPSDDPALLEDVHIFDLESYTTPSTAFTMVAPDPTALPVIIGPHSSIPVVIRYCQDQRDSVDAIWDATLDHGGPVTVDLHGERSHEPPMTVALDSIFVRVGEKAHIGVHITGGPIERASAVWDSLLLRFNGRSIVLTGVAAANGDRASYSYQSDSVVVIRRVGGAGTLTPDMLMQLEFYGLTSGVAENVIAVQAFDITAHDGISVKNGGFIGLSGCGLDPNVRFSRREAIQGVDYIAASNSVNLKYRAPSGAVPSLMLVDINGALVRSLLLPEGNDDEQSMQVDLDGLAPGFYVVLLRAGDDQSAMPIMVTKY
ncbi:MAG: hypothetical protein JST22_16805 [Bacteroidetes bacterium]|nr:hypothetical protein [Bacteroidota bacterium]